MIWEELKKGDLIGIVSPSTPVTDSVLEKFNGGVKYLENLGFKIKIGEHVFSDVTIPEEKAGDINDMFENPSVKAVFCSRGGDTAETCLDYLDWQIIEKNPKIFMGISDVTVLLNAIYKKTGLITFHGNDIVWGFGRNPSLYDRNEFLDRLVKGKMGRINIMGEIKTVRKGRAEGKLLGGNLRCFLKLAGTPYFPDIRDSILFLEALTMTPEKCKYMLSLLKNMGVFDNIKGVIIGYIYGLQAKDKDVMQMEDILLSITDNYDFPILKVNNFGHNCPNTVLPVGAKVRLDAGEQEIEIL